MNEIDGIHTRTKILILAVGTVLWLLLQCVINFISEVVKLALIASLLYLLYLAGKRIFAHRLCAALLKLNFAFSAGEGKLCCWEDFEEVRVQAVDYIYHAWKMIVDSGGE